MRLARWFVLLVILISLTPRLRAQSMSAFVGWIGLVSTPVGALPPSPAFATAGSGRAVAFTARAGHWQFGPGDDETTTMGVGVRLRARASELRLEIARGRNAQCSSCGVTMFGVDVVSPLKRIALDAEGASAITVAINPAFGIVSEEGTNVMSIAASVPFTLHFPLTANWRLSPFVAPGFGFARLSEQSQSETGHRAMLGGGVALSNTRESVQLSLGFRKILLDGAPSTFGLGLTWRRP